MKSRPRPGATAEVTFVAEEKHAIDFAEDGMPSVLSTLADLVYGTFRA